MKKSIFSLILFIFLVGCSSLNKEDHSFDYAGTIEPIGMSTWMYGTHTLTTTTGDFYALKAEGINLDKFNNLNVKLDAGLIEGYPVDSGPKYLDVKNIEIIK